MRRYMRFYNAACTMRLGNHVNRLNVGPGNGASLGALRRRVWRVRLQRDIICRRRYHKNTKARSRVLDMNDKKYPWIRIVSSQPRNLVGIIASLAPTALKTPETCCTRLERIQCAAQVIDSVQCLNCQHMNHLQRS
jgi:hypothetical protein